ncbi:hypothetical protein DDE18_17270 [Nocardioides gansuensis]|uniref:Uncharacterized protein n=1 Tax=Nocardioides gansuensis TaxID=2138300 RepID=A0A2T8F7N3_9ACTN|nr:hypothetical protein [Nocardioides gansuensis]PVG81726.1 hypothetical protein DDE18_17270 [Nocardioides gansuensis]
MNGAITTTAGGSVYSGSATLMVSTVKSPTWTVVEVDETAGSYFFFDVKPDSNAIYKVVYSGSSSTNGDVWSPSESLPVTVGVQRKVTASTRGTTFFGKVTPDYTRKPIKVERKLGKQWRKYKTIKTDARGKWRIKLPAPSRKKTFWRFTVKGDTAYLGWSSTGWTRRY